MFNFFKKKTDVTNFGKGLFPSPQDNNDYALSSQMPQVKRIPPEKPFPFDLYVHDQGNNPSCVGHSTSTVKEGMERKERVTKIFDGEWLYDECKKIDDYDGDGTYLRVALKVLKNKGLKVKGEDEDVRKYKIESYARVDDLSSKGIKKALSIYDFLLTGYVGSNEGWRTDTIRPPKEGENTWGHAIALGGYTDNYLLAQNSWGEDWGDNGMFKIAKNYLPFEAWAIMLDKPNEVETIGDEIRGWVASDFTTIERGDRITQYRLNLREEPTVTSDVIETLPYRYKIKTNGDIKYTEGYNWIPVLK